MHPEARYLPFQLGPIGRKLDLTGEPLLKLRQFVTNCVEGVARIDQLADRGSGEHRNAAVDANSLILTLWRVRNFACPQDANEPVACLTAQRDGAEHAPQRTEATEPDPTYFGNLIAPWRVLRRLNSISSLGSVKASF